MKNTNFYVVCLLVFLGVDVVLAVPAFPGAEGFGAQSIGGRGGVVYEVTNLDDSGPGSLRAAVEASGPRIVVFRVSGTISLLSTLQINNPYITIAGQTAPGDGICVKDYGLIVAADHVIIRYIRSRLGDNIAGNEWDAIGISSDGFNIILDHCSASWSVDETLSANSTVMPTNIGKVTVQWCIISESLNCSVHPKGCHGYGSIIGGSDNSGITYHHNLYAHHRARSPRPGNYNSLTVDPCGLICDFRNNVVYNWGGSYAGYNADGQNGTNSITNMNFVGNYYKRGSNSTGSYAFSETTKTSRAYFSNNWMQGSNPSDSWSLVIFSGTWSQAEKDTYKQLSPIPVEPVTTDDGVTAYSRILAHVGASLPVRDAVDGRIINDVINGTGNIINDEDEVGGWPTLNSLPAPNDVDHDGMPDMWETANGLNVDDANDRNGYDFDLVYTNLEVYLNNLIPAGTYTEDTAAPMPDPMTWAVAPESAGATQITMTATTAIDPGGVQYYFVNIVDANHDSGWQDSPTYTDTGLAAGEMYGYRVKARDKSENYNETGFSITAYAIPNEDIEAPEPDPMTWAAVPNAVSSSVITMTAITAVDTSGVEYYFANMTDANHDSGWQVSTIYTDTGLTPETTYTYQVKARDKSPFLNETAWSSPASDTTPSPTDINPPAAYWLLDETSGSIAHDVTGNTALAGTLQGTPEPNWTTGHFGNCLTFAANGQRVYVPSSSAIDFGDEDFSVSLWAIQPVTFSGQYELFIKGTIGIDPFPGSGKRYELYRKDSNFRFAIDDNVTKSEISIPTANFCTGNWVHIVAVRDTVASQIRLYADGVLRDTAADSTTSISQTEPLYIADGVFDNGAIDDVRIYRYALTQEQITEIYNGAGLSSYFCTNQIISDFDENCQVDFFDYAILAYEWENGTLDLADIADFALNWLTCNRDPSSECWQ